MFDMRPLTREEVEAGLRRLEPDLVPALTRLAASLSGTSVAIVVFEIDASWCFDTFPVTVTTYDAERVECDSPWHCEALFAGGSVLPAERRFPVGRFDLAGTDTTADYALVVEVVAARLRELWSALGTKGLEVYAGAPRVDDETSFTGLEFSSCEERTVELMDL